MQQKIRGVLSVDGANFVRYLYGAPLALGMLAFLVFGTGRHVPHLSLGFFAWVTTAGVAQIVATSLMIHAFSLRNYAVGTVYSKTETVFVAIFSTFVAHEALKLGAWIGILVCLSGVAILSVRGNFANVRSVLADLTHKGALYGLLSGAIFAIAAGGIREASKLMPEGDFMVRGITVLACMNSIQVVLMALYLARLARPRPGAARQGLGQLAVVDLGRHLQHAGVGLLGARHDAGERGAGARGRPDRAGLHLHRLPRRPEGATVGGRMARQRASSGRR